MFGLTPYNKNTPRSGANEFVDFYNMIDDFFNDSRPSFRGFGKGSFKMDIRENEKEYLIDAELPGVKKEEIGIDVNNNYLVISVKREEKVDEEKENYVHRERRTSSMQRSVYLGNIKEDGIKAKFDNGILSVAVPKGEIEEKKRPQIEIE